MNDFLRESKQFLFHIGMLIGFLIGLFFVLIYELIKYCADKINDMRRKKWN
jgi:tetrahydromethanopterin S-methyltransferase subunit G